MTYISPPRRPCTSCQQMCRTISGVCGPCQGLGQFPAGLKGGRWVNERGIQRWRPWTAEECVERTRDAIERVIPATRRRLLTALRSEQAGPSPGWRSPGLIPPTEATARARREALLDELDEHDRMTRGAA